MKCAFSADVSCLLSFTNEQCEIIGKAFRFNHNGTINDAIKRNCGWLFIRLNSREKENIEMRFTRAQVENIIKALESEQSDMALDLIKKLQSVLVLLYGATIASNLVLKPLNVDDV